MKGVIKVPKKKKPNLEPEIEQKLQYIGLSLDKVPEDILQYKSLNYRIPKGYDEKQYKQYRYIPVNQIQILLSPTNRLDALEERYKKARPLLQYLDQEDEENILKHAVFLNMLKQMNIEEIEKIEEEQNNLAKTIPFKVKFEGSYLWQIYYAEVTGQYFMIVPTTDSDYSAFFYLLKKKLENKNSNMVYVPVIGVEYSKNYLSREAFEDIQNYLRLFAKEWPSIYEVYNEKNELAIHIVGETSVYGKIRSLYRIVLKNSVEANHFYKLLKAMFIMQTEIPNYFEFRTDVNTKGTLEFYFNDTKIEYGEMANFIKDRYAFSIGAKQEVIDELEKDKKKLQELKRIASQQDVEYLEKEKQISTFLECKKTFFGKFKYYFKYSKKNKKQKEITPRRRIEIEEELEEPETRRKDKKMENDLKGKRCTIEDLIQNYKVLEEEETKLKNTVMDINAIKLKNKNMEKKIENATRFIEEIDNHKRSIFEFWKYSNKDEMAVLPEGEEEEVGVVKRIEKVFDYAEDFEKFGINLDKLQREKLTDDEKDSIYIATTNLLEMLNKLKTNTAVPKEVENLLKILKRELRESEDDFDTDDFDIFGDIVRESNKIKKIGNKLHREAEKDKFRILEITKMTRQIGFKLSLEQMIKNIKSAFGKVQSPEDIMVYKAIMGEKMDENQFNLFDMNPENEMQEVCQQEGNQINLYKISLKQGQDILGFTNCIFYDNQNKTLPLGMDFSSKVMIDISQMDLDIKKTMTFHIATLENEEDVFSKIIVKKVTVYE